MLTPHHTRRWYAAIALVGLVVPDLAAQRVTIRAVEAPRGTPVSGAIVTLLGGAGSMVARGLTSELGRITFRLEAATQVQIRIERAGFVDTVLAARTVQGVDTIIVSVPVRKPEFPTTLVAGARACPTAPDLEPPFGQLYAEARKALRAVDLAEQGELLSLGVTSFVRTLSPSLKLESEEANTLLGPANRPNASGAAGELLAKGFLTRSERGPELAAPTAGFFLADGFLTGYCFTLERGADQREGMLGLGFAPHAGATGGISGTIWFDAQTRKPISIDYLYRGPALGVAPRRGGPGAPRLRTDTSCTVRMRQL